MGYRLEGGKNQPVDQAQKVSENISAPDSAFGKNEVSEDYEDCRKTRAGDEGIVSDESIESENEDFEYCKIQNSNKCQLQESKGAETSESYDDCSLVDLKVTEEVKENFSDKINVLHGDRPETEKTASQNITDRDIADAVVEKPKVFDASLENNGTTTLMEMPKEEIVEDLTQSKLADLTNIRNEHADSLVKATDDLERVSQETTEKFNAAMKEERGTEEYKTALQEYNESKDRQTEIHSQISELVREQDVLNQKTTELRNTHIEKGEHVVTASAATLAASQELQSRFNNSFYEDRPDIKTLNNLQEENNKALVELSSERASIQHAMEAKMLELSDSEGDPYYQQIIAEYKVFDETFHRLDYHVAMLNENNLRLSERMGTEYEPINCKLGSRIKEVADGTDIPGETNYFIDETKSKEILAPFKQNEWEQLSLIERKTAVNQLAYFNAEILGIENPPNLVYYRSNDPTDFGGFSGSQHTIFINDSNMGDALETADTISHEYRHCYQHERTEKLETERDLEYKEGFDNYISPENNYYQYKNQLVEKDAREYADAIKNKIVSIDFLESYSESVVKTAEPDGNSYQILNPEKGAVFEETILDKLPEDFKKKNIEVRESSEVFEVKELNEIKNHVALVYENGARIAQKIEAFNTYKEHHVIEGGHIGKVHEKSLEAANVLEVLFKEKSYNGLYSANIDRKLLEMMALYHDTGMDGNVNSESFDQVKRTYLDKDGRKSEFIAKEKARNPKMTDEDANRKYEAEAFESQFRKEHSVQSAIHAIRDREFIEHYNVDADKVALGCLLHSKSNSGVENLADESQWNDAISRLEKAVAEYNSINKDKISFSDSFLKNTDGSFNHEAIAKMRGESLSLRIGDANGHDSCSRTSQNGKEIRFSLDDWNEFQNNLPKDLVNKIEKGEFSKFKMELQAVHVNIDGNELNDQNDKDGLSRMFAVGEGNFKSLSSKSVDGMPTQVFELENGNAYPLSTQYCILERLREYDTAKIEPQQKIEPSQKVFKDLNNDQIPNIDFVAEIHIGKVGSLTIESYKAFANRVLEEYNIIVVINTKSLDTENEMFGIS